MAFDSRSLASHAISRTTGFSPINAERTDGLGGFGSDGSHFHMGKLFEQFWQIEPRVKMFHRRGAGERNPIRARFQEFRGCSGRVFGFGHGFVNGDIVHNRTQLLEGFGQLGIRHLSAQEADFEVLDGFVLFESLGDS